MLRSMSVWRRRWNERVLREWSRDHARERRRGRVDLGRSAGSDALRTVALLGTIIVVTSVAVAQLHAATLQDDTRRAYDEYNARATGTFMQRFTAAVEPRSGGRALPPRAEISVGPAAQDGIIGITGGLVHHWAGTSFIPGVTLDDALAVSVAYDAYHRMYTPIVGSRLLEHDGNSYRATFRIRESSVGRTVVLDVTSRIVYTFRGSSAASSVSNAEQIREVADAGSAGERLLPAGRDSGYLWRAATLTSLVARDGGVAVTMETIGLSRGFPPLLGWVIEPIARRIGRKSVELSLREFHAAVVARATGSTGAA